MDEAIGQTQAVIDQLKRVKRGLMQQLFTRGIPEWHSEFKSVQRFTTYPADWEIKNLSECLEGVPESGVSPVASGSATGFYVLSLSALSLDGYVDTQWKPVEEKFFSRSKSLSAGDLLISRSNTHELVGLAGIYRAITDMEVMFPDLMMRLKPKSKVVNASYLSFYLLSPTGRSLLKSAAAGTSGSMKKINKANLLKLKVLVPSVEEQEKMATVFSLLLKRVEAEQAKKSQLEALKKGLMQGLLSGRMEVSA